MEQLLEGLEYDTSSEIRDRYSRDASIFQVTPAAVVYPRSVGELSELVLGINERRALGEDISLTPRNAGTCMSGGSLTSGLMIDMTRHFSVISDVQSDHIWVQGGVMHAALEDKTHPHNLYFPPYTSSHRICGVGGMLGNNASGEKSIKYGPTSDNVSEIRVLLSDGNTYEFGPLNREQLEEKKSLQTFEGELYRRITRLIEENDKIITEDHPKVKKNAAGYALWELWNKDKTVFNMTRLFIGSQGTLGIITDAKLRLIPFAKARRTILVPIGNLADLTPVVQTMLRYAPDTCETFDRHTYERAKKYFPEDAARAHHAEGKHLVVFATFERESQEDADTWAGQAKDAMEDMGYRVSWLDDQAEVDSYLLIRRQSFKMLLEHPDVNSRAMPYLEDTIVPIRYYGEFLAGVEAILSEYDMVYTYAGHIGDGSIRLVPLVNMEAEGAAEQIMESAKRIYDLVFAFGGSISVDHNDGIIRTPFLARMYGEELAGLFKEIKDLFDPLCIFNPGKKVGGTRSYALEHIIRKNAN
jgi:FAD/FMN-containing dehydrogenase